MGVASQNAVDDVVEVRVFETTVDEFIFTYCAFNLILFQLQPILFDDS